MTKIDLNNGLLYLKEITFPMKNENLQLNERSIANNAYSNLTLNGQINGIPFSAVAYYKNEKIRNINLSLKTEYLKKLYQPEGKIDIRDFYSSYIDFWKSKTEEMIADLLNTNKRNFNWGKVMIQVDPRGPTVFAENSYL